MIKSHLVLDVGRGFPPTCQHACATPQLQKPPGFGMLGEALAMSEETI